jgi:ubiquitin-protein ligase
MSTPQEQRRIRIGNDYKEMRNILGNIISWEIVTGTVPYVEEYKLEVKVRTIIGPRPDYRDNHLIQVTLPPAYPYVAPLIVMQSSPQPYHPNWFGDKRWCYGSWDIAEGLGHHVIRMIRTLQFDAEITNPRSPANSDATAWYLANLNKRWFPCDRQVLPDPTKSRFEIASENKVFIIG